MKKNIVIFSLILLSCSVIYSQSNTEIDKRLQKFYKQFAHDNMTEVELTEKYGEPNSIERKKTGYLNDEIIIYYYDSIGDFRFLYKSKKNVTFFVGYNLYADFLCKQNFPMTIEEVEKYFNHKFYRIEEDEKIYLCYFGAYTINFIFLQNSLVYFIWSP
jgi:hypothetical protein